ncbi:MAG: 4Fe-4S dicluster domain-containing protein [Alphaproteobacteria bacterium]
MNVRADRHRFTPDPDQMALWPDVSGNAINGLGETAPRRPSPVYWHEPDSIPHGPLQNWFYSRYTQSPDVAASRARRQKIIERPLPDVAPVQRTETPPRWAALVKEMALSFGADDAGIARMDPAWIFEGHEQRTWTWAIAIAVAHDYEALKTAPADPAATEVVNQYGRALSVVKDLTGWIRKQGWAAEPKGGPMAGSMVMIPAAIKAGFGELGRHGSMIHRTLGANFRLALVLTDLPLVEDGADEFGADDFCTRCQVCTDACPPAAIADHKRWIRGVEKWYVDFDRCLPFFNENKGCGICIAVCPWSRPGVAGTLVEKLARRRDREG